MLGVFTRTRANRNRCFSSSTGANSVQTCQVCPHEEWPLFFTVFEWVKKNLIFRSDSCCDWQIQYKCFLLKDVMLAQAVLGWVILIQPLRPSIWICGLNEVVLWVAKCLFMAAICERRWMGSFWPIAPSLFLDVKSQLGIMEQALFGISLHYLGRRAYETLSRLRWVEHLSEADFLNADFFLFLFFSK